VRYVLMLLTVGLDDGTPDSKQEVADQVREMLGGDFPVVATSELRETWS